MRPKPKDSLSHPLDTVLGAEANVRILRSLLRLGPQTVASLAQRTGLTPAGARRAADRLLHAGILENPGGTRGTLIVPEAHPFRRALEELFRVEGLATETLLRELRDRLGEMEEVQAAWIEEEPMETGDPLQVRIEVEPRSLPRIRQQVRQRIQDLELPPHPRIELDIHTGQEETVPPKTARFLKAPHRFTRREGTAGTRSKSSRHARALADSRMIAKLLRRSPDLVSRALSWVDRILRESGGTSRNDLLEWQSILLTHTPFRIAEILEAENPRSERLRQSSPFPPVLSNEERAEIESHRERP